MKLDNYKCIVTKGKKEVVWHYSLPYKMILEEVDEHYKEGADAVELEMITQQEFDDLLPKEEDV
tara:strand:+ start:7337 stop:7528 length:192 start_codon:yes stop_codon:yes gene_type:complete